MLAIALVVMAAAFILAFLYKKNTRKELEELEEYNKSPAVLMQIEEYDSLTIRNSFLVGQYLSIAYINENLDTYPWATSEVQNQIFKLSEGYANVTITSCNADSGTTNMAVTAEKPQIINEFITILMGQKMFHDVTYTGYSYNNDGLYQVNVSCTLEEATGRGGDNNED